MKTFLITISIISLFILVALHPKINVVREACQGETGISSPQLPDNFYSSCEEQGKTPKGYCNGMPVWYWSDHEKSLYKCN